MIEGGSSRDHALAKTLLYREPQTLHALLKKLAQAVTDYLFAQVSAGAQALMIFDTWGGALSAAAYREFSLAYMQEIVTQLRSRSCEVPITLFTKGGGLWLEAMAATGCDALGLDWTINIGDARKRVGDKVALQGNLDPALLYSNTDTIRQAANNVLADFGSGPGHIFNLGHGITPQVDPERLGDLVAAVRELSPRFHQ